jgi:hypothetical protein
MGSRQSYIEHLKKICEEIRTISYEALKEGLLDFYNEKRETDLEAWGDITVESRLIKFDNKNKIDDVTRAKLQSVIEKIKSNSEFNQNDKSDLGIFVKKIDFSINQCQYITNIYDGPNNYVKNHSLDLVNLFNDIRGSETSYDFLQQTSIDKAFVENPNFRSFLIYLFVTIKNIKDKDRYPLFYKYYQNIAKYFFGIELLDYDKFCIHYNEINFLGNPKALEFNLYYFLLGQKLKNELITQNFATKDVDLAWLKNNLFDFENSEIDQIDESLVDDVIKRFFEWIDGLQDYKESSKKYVKRDILKVDKISEDTNLGSIFIWGKEDWEIKYEVLQQNPEIIANKSPNGSGWYSASLSKFKEYFELKLSAEEQEGGDNESTIIPPINKYLDYRWYWASSQPVLEFNRLDIICGVTKIIGELGGRAIYNLDFKTRLVALENQLQLAPRQLSKSSADTSKNVLASAREYWQGTGLINSDNSLTTLGAAVANNLLTEDQLAIQIIQSLKLPNRNLPNRYTPEIISRWEELGLELAPLKLLIDILLTLYYNYNFGTESYITTDELVNIIIPIAADTPGELNKFCLALISYRNGTLNYSNWPKYSSGGAEDKRLPKEFLVALSYWGFLEQVEIKGSEDTRYYLTNKARNLFSIPISQNEKKGKNKNCKSPFKPEFKENKIFFGAPGTGKSTRITKILEERDVCDKFVARVTFHPEYDYASFVGGYKPFTDEKGSIKYEFVPQTFTNLFVSACNNLDTQFYLIIEEINRGNCAEIFGDLFQLLDRNPKYAITTSIELMNYLNSNDSNNDARIKASTIFWDRETGKMLLPDNITLWATMNTSDQSLMPMDSAFKRRWEWEYIPINESKSLTNESSRYIIQIAEKEYSWLDFIISVNMLIRNKETQGMDKCIGNYFLKPSGFKNGEEIIIYKSAFVNKVLFYLWNDVFKDEEYDDHNIFYISAKGIDKYSSRKVTFEEISTDENLIINMLERLVNKIDVIELKQSLSSNFSEKDQLVMAAESDSSYQTKKD